MRANRVETRIFIFCLTFIFGFLTVKLFVSISNDEKVLIKSDAQPNQINIEQSKVNPPCKKYFDYSDKNNLVREDLNTKEQLLEKIKSAESRNLSDQKTKGQDNSDKKFSEIEKELQKLEEIMKDAQKREDGNAQTLIYVENCSEYNESR